MREPRRDDIPHQHFTTVESLVSELRRIGDPKAVVGMKRYGIQSNSAFGVSVPRLRALARKVGKDHELALKLWGTRFHDARLLAGMIDIPALVTLDQMEDWAADFDSWDVVDGTCGNLFDKTPYAVKKAHEWSGRKEEFVKRAGFVLMAELAVHDKKADDQVFLKFLPVVLRESSDSRNFVKKAVNWALRQIGKKNVNLNKAAIQTSEKMLKLNTGPARWIATDALRELSSPEVQERLQQR